ncbi:uncharacterized protein T551_03538 [Pneumocystis jirovecii RU7]|uniref:Glutathione peroxidase n=1 Tax=Pneumocystis jirovecii (strain RU7) TaxID=1408657 RepID=A0A0W4ZD66_PNEJ7|nr:uncharacterized protein T551_03538 [Pneumocystis jirovecii RU7]KTW26238.1 hypothetical protein T551_03538 [Pneumocystis jirovecii RU7]
MDLVNFYDFKPTINNEPYDFSKLKNTVVLIVNVASKCRFTPQYSELEKLYQKYKDSGFLVIGFPCNQFGSQEPGSYEEITRFCSETYNITFPIMDKIDVNGPNSHPLYLFLKKQKGGCLGLSRIKWNFEKFLIDRNGNVASRYSSITRPDTISSQIEKLLE